jgi:CDP-glucose 4,6-dehydratase
MEPLLNLYRGRKVLVTGHTGFKGSWLTLLLQQLGAEVLGYSLPPEEDRPSLFVLANVQASAQNCFGDIRDLTLLQKTIRDFKPEIIFHNAAQALVRRSYTDPLTTLTTNVIGTANVLEAGRHCSSVRAVVVVTTDKCYENREWLWAYREEDRLGGHDIYSSSKACAELLTAAYRNSFFRSERNLHVATVRAGNVIGGGDWAEDRIVPDIVRALSTRQYVTLRRPEATRPWQHVLDPLHGYLILAQRLISGKAEIFAEPWNFGPDSESTTTVKDLVEAILSRWGEGMLRTDDSTATVHEAGLLKLDSTKARIRLGWRPLLPLEKSLDLTVEWYKSVLQDNDRARPITERQISDFLALTKPAKTKAATAGAI